MGDQSYEGAKPGINGIPVGGLSIGGGDDATELSKVCKVLIPATDGNIEVVMHDGTEIVLPACKAGIQYWGLFKQVKSSNTTATGIVGLY